MAEEATVKTPPLAPAAVPAARDTVALYDGEELRPETAGVITKAMLSRVVVLAGPTASGKTTLLATIYEKFCCGPFAGFRFAGSRTLWGLERRCHPWRVASGRAVGATERTPQGGGQLMLHLSLQRETNCQFADLLIADISGESFEAATEATADCRLLTMVRRADHFVLCLDGKKLLDSGERHRVITDGHSILRAFTEAGMLGKFSTVTVLFTKADLFHQADAEMTQLREEVAADYRRNFGERLGAMYSSTSSAEALEKVVGVDELLGRWVNETKLLSNKPFPTPALYGDGLREIDKFGRAEAV